MLISLAAASIDKYQWYQYQGKRILAFEDHNPKYDLDLEPKMKFGVRKYGGKLKLALLAEPDIVFTMSESEIKKVVRLSKGWSGTVKGKKLVSGIGGKDKKPAPPKRDRKPAPPKRDKEPTRRRPPVSAPETNNSTITKSSKYFPDIPIPPKPSDVLRLYTYFNKLLFDNECPPKIKVAFPNALKFRGQAEAKPVNGVYQYTLKLSKSSLTDRDRVINIVVHEMIHLFHYKRVIVDKNFLYQNAGHGPLFLEEMHRLNKLGYNIDTKERDVEEAELVAEAYVLMVHASSNMSMFFYSTTPFKSDLPIILESIRTKLNSNLTIMSYSYGTSKSNHAFLGTALTKNNRLGARQRLRGLKTDNPKVTTVLNSLKIETEKTLTKDLGDIRQLFKNVLDGSSDAVYLDFPNYVATLCLRSGYGNFNTPMAKKDMEASAKELLSDEEFKAARTKWAHVKDHHLSDSESFKACKKSLLKYQLDGVVAVHQIGQLYHKLGLTVRLDNKRLAELTEHVFGDIITMTGAEVKKAMINFLNRPQQ